MALIEQEVYAKEFRRQAESFRVLARIKEAYAETEKDRGMVAVALGLAEVCELLAEDQEEPVEEPEEDE